MVRFFFDVDGVLLDFESQYLQVLRDHFRLQIPDGYQPTSWLFSDLLNPEQMQEGWEHFIASAHFGTMEPLIEPSRFNEVYGAHPVHFITNIPLPYLEVRRQNLMNLGFHFESIHCGGMVSFDHQPPKTKGHVIRELTQEKESVFFLDDHPDNCVNVHELIPESMVWLMSRSFNQEFDHPQIRRASHWEEVLTFSSQLLSPYP